MKTLVLGFAVSHWQDPEKWNWQQLKAGGVELVVARACLGDAALDKAFARYHRACRDHQLLFGASLVFRPSRGHEAQLALFDRQLDAIGGLQAGDLLPTLELREDRILPGEQPSGTIRARGARKIAEIWSERFGGMVVRYSSLFPDWMGVNGPDSGWTWMLGTRVRHWLLDDDTHAGQPRSSLGSTWHLHQFGRRSLAEYDHGAVEVPVTTRNQEHELSELLIQANSTEAELSHSQITPRNTNQVSLAYAE